MGGWRSWRNALGLRAGSGRRGVAIAVVVPIAAAGFGLGYAVGADRTEGGGAADFMSTSINAEADTYTRTAAPETPAGSETELLVGGSRDVGVATAYLRFTVSDAPVREPRLHVAVVDARPKQLLELTRVAARWTESGLTAAEIPPFGDPVDAATATDGQVTFDLSKVVTKVGVYAFAITSPDEKLLARLQAREGDTPPRLDYKVPVVPTPGQHSLSSPSSSSSSSSSTEAIVGSDLDNGCVIGVKLVPTCGALWGVAPGARSDVPRVTALNRFEDRTGRRQDIYHAYHRGFELFPTEDELKIANDPEKPRILFLNWKPRGATWAQIAAGNKDMDDYLDRLAEHIKKTYTEPFFFTVHHEPENDVDPRAGSGRTASDYAAMYRYVIQRLRADGVTNMVTVMVYMAYLDWAVQPWHKNLYPGDDVVDWVAWDAYAYSDPGYGYGDFAEMVDRTDGRDWPGYYRWATETFPGKPLMLAEWGVWQSDKNPGHPAEVISQAEAQISLFPRLKALVYFETANDRGKDSRVDTDPGTLSAYRDLSESRHFQVRMG
ncbi:hypothetical protein Afil01_57610 [Actinorhabdospora filicis]|uniref:GH26 domain-containing protein n=1 Tax=Actinorhabdospora filicis TaxID=1785913 RepID=A0A9W6SQ84_9ACTN|nr:glycosyl hydrolase [Actinorhabdospora filicis]GLZ80954.1 hypothetical protein Afil01_57610 [Actinorhabdospora filicis]